MLIPPAPWPPASGGSAPTFEGLLHTTEASRGLENRVTGAVDGLSLRDPASPSYPGRETLETYSGNSTDSALKKHIQRIMHSDTLGASADPQYTPLRSPRFRTFLVHQVGPFSVDCCVSRHGTNSFCRVGWTILEDDARVMDFRGHNAWGNLPFSDFLAILQNILRCKTRQQNGTAGTFLVPCWEGNPGYELEKSLPEVFRDARSILFTALFPEGRGRTFRGKTRFAVMVVHCPPGPVDWTDSELNGVTWLAPSTLLLRAVGPACAAGAQVQAAQVGKMPAG
ncbi:hypothetical protein CYMTET_51838 [Cymbomonas tetramitiformis]|uniref:Uncharacterized protein n=1 Tax=Cymbomonas tetramitiformis TaxID=36881 RepID=A0AAE0BLP1_9CHLO|nr:hypothetical protein CYMTET_51838 [Cymbomonas tetramitiformis]